MATDELLEAIRHLPDQVRDTAVAAADVDLPDREGITQVVILGVGAGQVAGDVIEALAELMATVPVIATGGRAPTWVGESTVAVAVSQSGNDLATVSAAASAREAGARVIAVTAGGALLEAGLEWDVPVVRIDPALGPAAGLGVAIVPILVLLERLGLASGMSQMISNTAEQLDRRRQVIDGDRTLAQAVAADIRGRVAIVCGAGAVGKHAARRWVQELDRVGGVPSVRRKMPSDRADVETWGRLNDQVDGGVAAIVLRHDFEPEGLVGGLDLLGDVVSTMHSIRAEGDGPLAQMLDLVLTADAVAAVVAADAGAPQAPGSDQDG